MIRTATIEDAEIIAEYNYRLGEETEERKLNRERLLKGVRAILSDPTKGTYYVYEAEGKVIGQLMITLEWSDWRNANFAWIQSVYVHPDYRNQNIFRKLYQHVNKTVASDPNFCGIRLYVDKNNIRAQTVYQKFGMNPSNYIFYEWEK
jgi:ribosomal protein S18 acetylase RimI-like enzyme